MFFFFIKKTIKFDIIDILCYYFIAKIKNEGLLTDVTSTSGVKQDEVIKITIEGNLPY